MDVTVMNKNTISEFGGTVMSNKTMQNILVIPDVHGRSFWKEAVERHPNADTIFLGDYHDPYTYEGISEEKSLENFCEIVNYARNHPNVHLLLGNHDLHYLCCFGEACRLDYKNSLAIHSLICDNIYLFRLMEYRVVADKTVVFTHAPILKEWLDMIEETDNIPLLSNNLNELLHSIIQDPFTTEKALGFISPYRGGIDTVGSPVWADMREIQNDNLLPTVDYNVFAHTQLKDAMITDRWANLDSRQAFLLTPDLQLIKI